MGELEINKQPLKRGIGGTHVLLRKKQEGVCFISRIRHLQAVGVDMAHVRAGIYLSKFLTRVRNLVSGWTFTGAHAAASSRLPRKLSAAFR